MDSQSVNTNKWRIEPRRVQTGASGSRKAVPEAWLTTTDATKDGKEASNLTDRGVVDLRAIFPDQLDSVTLRGDHKSEFDVREWRRVTLAC